MSFGTEFEYRCIRFEQQSHTTHHRSVSFVKIEDGNYHKIGMRMQTRSEDSALPLVEVYLDGTILVYQALYRQMIYSVREDILDKIRQVAVLVKDMDEGSVAVYRRKAQYAPDSIHDAGDDFGDFMQQKFGGPKGGQQETTPHRRR